MELRISTINRMANEVKIILQSGVSQLEILIWKAFVAIMRWKPGSLLPLAMLGAGIALLLAPLGYVLFRWGIQAFSTGTLEAASTARNHPLHQNIGPSQHNLLLVLADNLAQPEPGLDGVWLVINGNLNNGSKFLPVEAKTRVGNEPTGAWSGVLDRSGVPSKEFFDTLIERGLWWDYYLVIDRFGLGALTGWSGGALPQQIQRPAGSVDGPVIDDPAALNSIYQQAAVLRTLCERSQLINQALEPQGILSLLQGHFSTNYELSRLDEDWYSFRHRGFAWFCEFPTLQETSFLDFHDGSE